MSFMRFLGLGLADRVPDARTIWLFREKLTKAGAIQPLFDRFDATLRASGYIAMSGQIVDASLIAAPKQRNTQEEKQAIKEGRIPEDWKDKSAKLRQKDRDARWTVKFTKAKSKENGSTPPVDLAIPVFGYQNHISSTVASASSASGRRPTPPLTRACACAKACSTRPIRRPRSLRTPPIARRPTRRSWRRAALSAMSMPKGRPMPDATRRANAAKSKIRSRVEHVFAAQKDRMQLFVRTIGITRATVKIGMANLVYDINRLLFLRKTAAA